MSNASGIAIKEAFERIVRNQIPNQRLLGTGNYYKKDTIDKLKNDNLATLTRRKKQIEEYISASVIIHCSDGWGYLSRSVESLINGDIASSIHFAYYAELRAVMSIFAFEGIGIFDRKQVWFDSGKNADFLTGFTTHSSVDKGMQEWVKLSSKKDVLFSLLKVNNRSVTDWLRETGFSARSAYSSSIANNWLKKWCIDLHLKDDQTLRNEMSYRPHFEPHNVDIESTINKLTDIWNLLEPTGANRFPLLDKYLLRISLEEIFKKTTYKNPVGPEFENFLKNVFNRLGEDTRQILFEFLMRRADPNEHILFEEAKKDRRNIDINREEPFPIICRAILLLRISTGTANRLITESSLNTDNLRFWWENLSLQIGNTSSVPSGIDAVDLYTDIRESISEIEFLPNGSLNCIKSAFADAADHLFFLKQFQRTAIWGMGL